MSTVALIILFDPYTDIHTENRKSVVLFGQLCIVNVYSYVLKDYSVYVVVTVFCRNLCDQRYVATVLDVVQMMLGSSLLSVLANCTALRRHCCNYVIQVIWFVWHTDATISIVFFVTFVVPLANIHGWTKKCGTLLLSISLPIINRFSKFFHWRTLRTICNNVNITYPSTP